MHAHVLTTHSCMRREKDRKTDRKIKDKHTQRLNTNMKILIYIVIRPCTHKRMLPIVIYPFTHTRHHQHGYEQQRACLPACVAC